MANVEAISLGFIAGVLVHLSAGKYYYLDNI
jgi:hypothetical protein